MNARQGNAGLPSEDADSDSLKTCISAIESQSAEERRLTYQECAKFLLIRYLIEKKLVEEPLHEDECKPSAEELVAENADGIYYLFYVRGSVWGIMLSRQEESKRIIKENPGRQNEPELFVMDLKKAAKISLRNDIFRQ